MKETILIVEDEKDIVKMLEYNLRKDGYKVLSVRNGENAVAAARGDRPDLILLDLMLPGMDGLEVCKTLKGDDKTSRIPIIMLTAKSQEADKVVGLEVGADDYVTKPFSLKELSARIKAVIRRTNNKKVPSGKVLIGGLSVDFNRISVLVNNKQINLTAKEFGLLKELIHAKGKVLSRDRLLDDIWGIDRAMEIQTRTVDVHIRTLRKKLKTEAKRILTVKSYGYRFEHEN